MAELPRRPTVATVDTSASERASTDASAHGQIDEIVHTARRSREMLTRRGGSRIVFQKNRQTCGFSDKVAQRHHRPCDVWRFKQEAILLKDKPRGGDAYRFDLKTRGAARFYATTDEVQERRQHLLRVPRR